MEMDIFRDCHAVANRDDCIGGIYNRTYNSGE